MEESMVDVGPELFDLERERVDGDIEAPLAAGVAEGAFGGGVVEVGDARGGTGAEDFAGVEDFLAGVRAGDDDAAEGIAGALEEAAVAEGVIAVVLMRDGRDDGFREEVFAGLVDGGVPEVSTVGYATMTEFRIRVGFKVIASDG